MDGWPFRRSRYRLLIINTCLHSLFFFIPVKTVLLEWVSSSGKTVSRVLFLSRGDAHTDRLIQIINSYVLVQASLP